jgi:hypothetical protein
MLVRGYNCMYVDSYGGAPLDEVKQYCLRNKLKLGYSDFIIQSMTSTNCGLCALGCIKYCNNTTKQTLYDKCNEYINLFDNDTKLNDGILRKYLAHNDILVK